jgi:hypothetical protein
MIKFLIFSLLAINARAELPEECLKNLIQDVTSNYSRLWDDFGYNQITYLYKIDEKSYWFVLSNGQKKLLGYLVADVEGNKCKLGTPAGADSPMFSLSVDGTLELLLTPRVYDVYCNSHSCS